MSDSLEGKTILITGAARRLGRSFALACARAGADVGHPPRPFGQEADEVSGRDRGNGTQSMDLPGRFERFIPGRILDSVCQCPPLCMLSSTARRSSSPSLETTSLDEWQRHLQINLTAPFLLSQAFAKQARAQSMQEARIVNILDWRALRPGADHFPYTISKAALAAMTRSLAVALAPDITVNGLALGAILPPSDGKKNPEIIKNVPLKRWAELDEVEEALLFLLTCPPISQAKSFIWMEAGIWFEEQRFECIYSTHT
jgi:pteridine reductase